MEGGGGKLNIQLFTKCLIILPLLNTFELYLVGDIQEGRAISELLPLSNESKVDLVIDEHELSPDTTGRIQDKLLSIHADVISHPGGCLTQLIPIGYSLDAEINSNTMEDFVLLTCFSNTCVSQNL